MVLVPGPMGKEMTTNQWRSMWTRELAKPALEPIAAAGLVPHGLRKSAVVALKEAGCPNGEIQAITGHSLAMIDHYSKGFDQQRQAEAGMKRLENARSSVLQTPAFAGPK
jgi:integrase